MANKVKSEMRTFKLKLFNKWAEKEGLTETSLKKAVKEIENGLVDADLGGHLYKKRIGIQGRGKSGGVRTLLTFKIEANVFFMYGFAKNQRDNIEENELKALKRLAKELLT
ncbi:type II toxin-antitoxin system RelE/ParE family toxin [Candidatus Parabeggiatoa sp. HSG14]|uniref:type II toxin-antitoxin system RelE/ParE family toxin n=1 Tax=Candidatus Parabeggiatoa sp. HSG14 TaxID=3055593 RepID=UPI0025A8394C|nr:type II toxin-antitoxin system RelE/ParE family toxin [Thiotrichales bacterium HSG14]